MDKTTVLELRKNHKLHEVVENRLQDLFKLVSSDLYTIKEGIGTTSGRTDTTTFSGKGKIIHIEIIASASMVLNDINNLHQSSADEKIVVLMNDEYDPAVAKEYYKTNAKNIFPRVWLSDVLEEKSKDRVVGRFEEILQAMDRKIANYSSTVLDSFNSYVDKLQIPKESVIAIHMGLFPRKKLNLFKDETDTHNLFKRFDPLGIIDATDPLGTVGGLEWEFSHQGEFFVLRDPPKPYKDFTQIGIANNGQIIFTFVDSNELITEIHSTLFTKLFNPTFVFCHSLFTVEKYDGIIDIVTTVSGVKGKLWVPKSFENNPTAQLLHGMKFYENQISFPLTTFEVAEINITDKRDHFYNMLYIKLQRNTNDIKWGR